MWTKISEILKEQTPASHPRTVKFVYPEGGKSGNYYLKIHYAAGRAERFKDRFRDSKAFRALKQGEALAASGFGTPPVVAAGEERRHGFVRRAFLLTLAVQGSILPGFLKTAFPLPLKRAALTRKRDCLSRLAAEIRRLHEYGFVHGDLTPNNIFVRFEGQRPVFFFMDNDRTRRYPRWLPHGLWRRNLVQLNRFILPGITLQDRLRFLRVYLGKNLRSKRERRLVQWLEKNTRRRWLERSELASHVSFRELLSWNGPFRKRS